MSPSLASIITPREAMGREAATLLMARLAGNPVPQTRIDLGFTLYPGDSLG
ncbi:DNA-binding LacI/PurR family transcriptional regulator [Aeromonas sp. BIGb0405]|nr:DNA-binding LacI/PurR family transcriptional regulator [Aeromonas sp. BIGb0405]